MNTTRIDLVNIALMIISCVAAFVVPFELFLFSYAVLGPLHYLTEIGWLHKRDYFANGKKDYRWLVALCILLTSLSIISTYRDLDLIQPGFASLIETFGQSVFDTITVMIFLSFVLALSMVLFRDTLYKILFFAVALILGAAFSKSSPFIFPFGIFLPTLIHVFVFTGLFILYGALKSKSKTGIASLLVFAGCAVSFFTLHPKFQFYSITSYAEKALVESGFVLLKNNILSSWVL